MSESPVVNPPPDDQLWIRTGSAALRPSLGEIGLQHFAPYLINSVSLSWTTHLANALKAHEMTTTKMRALAILSISSPVTINELSLYALTKLLPGFDLYRIVADGLVPMVCERMPYTAAMDMPRYCNMVAINRTPRKSS